MVISDAKIRTDLISDSKNSEIEGTFSLTKNPFRWSKKFYSKFSSKSETSTNEENSEFEKKSKLKRTSSIIRKYLNRFVDPDILKIKKIMKSKNISSNELCPLPPNKTPGVTGLKNHGNTCFMNAVLQCLSHTDLLAEYFVLDQYKIDLKRRNKFNSRKFGTKGELTEQLANVLKCLWMCKDESEHSTSFKAVVDRYGAQFSSSTQHDAQEFLLWLMDKVHEDLNTATKRKYKCIKNSYGRPDELIAAETLANHIRCNNSFVQAVFQAQFRSSLTCPQCEKQSNTFDPFHCISVQLPQISQQVLFITVLYLKQHPKQVRLGLSIPAGSPVLIVRQQLNFDTNIATDRIILVEINNSGFSRIFYDYQPCSILNNEESIYCVEMPVSRISDNTTGMTIMLLVTNLKVSYNNETARFGTPFCIEVDRDLSFLELQKKLLREMSLVLKPEVFSYKTSPNNMFRIRLQDPSADPDSYLENVEHPLFTELIDMALSLANENVGSRTPHINLILEWKEPELFFNNIQDIIVEHESVQRLKDRKPEPTLSLEQCLEHYTKAETLSKDDAWNCPNCKKYLPVVKTLGLWSLPNILVIHLKRFRQQEKCVNIAAKLTTMVKFPLQNFDMSPHIAKPSNNCGFLKNSYSIKQNKNKKKNSINLNVNEKESSLYDLYAVCYHQGDTLETGHYTAACKNPYDQQWYKFDDQKVSKVQSNNIENEIINNDAYILFYQRKDLNRILKENTSMFPVDHWINKIFQISNFSEINESVSVNDDDLSNSETDFDDILKSDNSIESNIIINNNNLSQICITESVEDTTKNTLIVKVEVAIQNNHLEENVEELNTEKSNNFLTSDGNSSNFYNKDIILKRASSDLEIKKDCELQFEKNEENYEYHVCHESTNSAGKQDFSIELIANQNCNGIELNESSLCAHLGHTLTTNSTMSSMLMNNCSSCSRDTLIFIDQQHSLLNCQQDLNDDIILENRAIWMSPVGSHKLITVSPKN